MDGEVKILQTFMHFKQKHLLLFHVNSLWHYRYFGEGWKSKKINLPKNQSEKKEVIFCVCVFLFFLQDGD